MWFDASFPMHAFGAVVEAKVTVVTLVYFIARSLIPDRKAVGLLSFSFVFNNFIVVCQF